MKNGENIYNIKLYIYIICNILSFTCVYIHIYIYVDVHVDVYVDVECRYAFAQRKKEQNIHAEWFSHWK